MSLVAFSSKRPEKGATFGLAVLLAAALSLAGCQNPNTSLTDPMATGSTSKSGEPSFKRTEQLAKAFKENPADSQAGLAFAEGLQKLGQNDTMVDVLRQVANQKPKDAAIQAQVGKKFLSMGENDLAVEMLQRAVALNPQDWQTVSALGAALDQQRRQFSTAQAGDCIGVPTTRLLSPEHSAHS